MEYSITVEAEESTIGRQPPKSPLDGELNDVPGRRIPATIEMRHVRIV